MIPHTFVSCASQATERSTAADLAKHVFENVFKLSHRNQSTCFWDWVSATSNFRGQNNRRVCPNLLRERWRHPCWPSTSLLRLSFANPKPASSQNDSTWLIWWKILRRLQRLFSQGFAAPMALCQRPPACWASWVRRCEVVGNRWRTLGTGNRADLLAIGSWRESHSIPPKPHQTTFHT